jgi:hypothetical protein
MFLHLSLYVTFSTLFIGYSPHRHYLEVLYFFINLNVLPQCGLKILERQLRRRLCFVETEKVRFLRPETNKINKKWLKSKER